MTAALAIRWTTVTVGCAEPETSGLATFCAELLHRPLSAEDDGPDWATVGSRRDSAAP